MPREAFAGMPPGNWTVLVQGVNLHHDGADDLLQRFSFIPRARLDDLMVSFAAPGGGVGPHVDSYDVFLLQGEGRRRWRIGAMADAALLAGAPLAVLARFRAQREWDLNPGDMLYLPPGCAHDGVALDPCTTYSIGFRAPTARQIAAALLLQLEAELERGLADRRYRDGRLSPSGKSGLLPASMVQFTSGVSRSLRLPHRQLEACLGEHLSEPKPLVAFEPPLRPLQVAVFERRVRARGMALDRRSCLLYRGGRFFMNGETALVHKDDRRLLERLADARRLPAGTPLSAPLRKLLHVWYVAGWLHAGKTDVATRRRA
jgi:50S ribosomal protein L16 3-hydroxylase